MIKTFDFLLFAINATLFGGIFYAQNHPSESPSEIVTHQAAYIDFTTMSPEDAAECWIDRMITYAQAEDLDNFYEIAKAGAKYQEELSPNDLERSREATKRVLQRREAEFNDAMQVINRAYQNADPETKAKMDSFFGG